MEISSCLYQLGLFDDVTSDAINLLLEEEKNAHLLLLNRRSRSSVACIHPTEDISWDRINWDRARRIGEYEGSFTQEYRMPAVSFDILLEKLRPKITPDPRISSGKTKRGALLAEHVLAFTLRYLGGASYHELKKVYGMKKTNLYHWIHKCIQAINEDPTLEFSLPTDRVKLAELAAGFRVYSKDGLFSGCVGALDGWLCVIRCPRESETPSPIRYYSGHYGVHGVNVQAVCDSFSRFTYASIMFPGATNDLEAFEGSSLFGIHQQFPWGFYLLADNAYTLSDRLLVPFFGSQRCSVSHFAFNFYLSQLRIKIEQAFGLLVTKWRILRAALEVALHNVTPLIFACMRLHNFVITERIKQTGATMVDFGSEIDNWSPEVDLGYLPVHCEENTHSGYSFVREKMVQHILEAGRVRPAPVPRKKSKKLRVQY